MQVTEEQQSNKLIIELIHLCPDFLLILWFCSSKIHTFAPFKKPINVSAIEE